MTACSPIPKPNGAALWHGLVGVMDVILHLGAHRTAMASLEDHLRRQSAALSAQRTGYWGPRKTQAGLHSQILSDDVGLDAVSRRVHRRLARAHRFGLERLLISDANMIGTVADNISRSALYPDAGARMARFARVFGDRVTTVVLCPRSLDLYWCSALASGVHSGTAVPDRPKLRKIAFARRGWRDVISDIAGALPGARVKIVPFEQYSGLPSVLLKKAFGIDVQDTTAVSQRNAAPTLPELRRALSASGTSGGILPFGMGRWNPFLNDEHAALRELYADDMMWLAGGADGLVTKTENGAQDEAGPTPPLRTNEKGRCDECEERQLARPG